MAAQGLLISFSTAPCTSMHVHGRPMMCSGLSWGQQHLLARHTPSAAAAAAHAQQGAQIRLSTDALTAGRVGSAFAAELGTMAVTEQTDSLRMLGSDPVDYLVSPRVVACMIATPILTMMCFVMGAPSVHAASCKAWCWVPSWLDRYGAWTRTCCVDTAGVGVSGCCAL